MCHLILLMVHQKLTRVDGVQHLLGEDFRSCIVVVIFMQKSATADLAASPMQLELLRYSSVANVP